MRESLIETMPIMEFRSFNTIETLLTRLEDRDIDLGVFPIEDTFLGGRRYLMSALAQRGSGLHVMAEINHHHSLFVVVPEEIKQRNFCPRNIDNVLYMNNGELQQTMKFLGHIEEEREGSDCHPFRYIHTSSVEEAYDKMLDPNLGNSILLVSDKFIELEVNELHRFSIVRYHVENDINACCRYIIIAKQPLISPDLPLKFKTSLIIRSDGSADMLLRIIFCFSSRDIPIYQLDSHPSLETRTYFTLALPAWQIMVSLEVAGHTWTNPVLQNALHHLREFVSDVTVLGSFPIYSNMKDLERIESVENRLGGPYGL
jgi:prephenate dehydratase